MRSFIPLVLAAVLVGCAAPSGDLARSSGDSVQLLTGWGPYPPDKDGIRGCFTYGISGELVSDDKSGTTVNGVPIMWPVGFTGRRSGLEVEVLDAAGKVVASTSNKYNIPGGYWTDETVGGVFLACGEAIAE